MFTLRHLMGESLSSLSVKELKQLENRLERGITRIRSKKVNHLSAKHSVQLLYCPNEFKFSSQHELLFAEIEYMQKRVKGSCDLIGYSNRSISC